MFSQSVRQMLHLVKDLESRRFLAPSPARLDDAHLLGFGDEHALKDVGVFINVRAFLVVGAAKKERI